MKILARAILSFLTIYFLFCARTALSEGKDTALIIYIAISSVFIAFCLSVGEIE